MSTKFRDVVREIAWVANVRFSPSRAGRSQQKEENLMWETPEYTVIEVCAEATGYFYRG